MTRMLRALEADRISVHKDDSTSIIRQHVAVEHYCDSRGIKIIGRAVDDGVSASKVSPFDRPGLGPWLTDPVKINSFDVIVWWRMDRAVRTMTDLHMLADWAKRHNKQLVFAEGLGGNPLEFDMTSPIGIMLMTFLAFAAEMEAQSLKERVQSSHDYLATQPRWAGGTAPYGYRIIDRMVNGSAEGKTLEIAPDEAKILREVVDLIIGGESLFSVAALLNRWNVPTSRIAAAYKERIPKWHSGTLSRMLSSETMLGYKVAKGHTVRTAEGEPIILADPIIDVATFRKLQQALGERNKHRTRTRNTAPLTNIIFCGVCKGPAYRQVGFTPKNGKKYRDTYVCHGKWMQDVKACPGVRIFEDELMTRVEEVFLEHIGPLDRPERQFIPGSDHTAELENVEHALDNLQAESDRGLVRDRERYLNRLSALLAQHEKLAALPSEPDRWEERPSGKTWGQWWEESTEGMRRELLLDVGFKVWLLPGGDSVSYWPGKSGMTAEEFLASLQEA